MKTRAFLTAGAVAAALAGSALLSSAQAAGIATGNVNMRAGPGTGHPVITTIPAGAPVQVHACPSWCQVTYAGRTGWASSNYISTAQAVQPMQPPVVYRTAPRVVYQTVMPERRYWRHGRPWWDDRHGAWYDGRNWWYEGRWHNRPRAGFGIEFRF